MKKPVSVLKKSFALLALGAASLQPAVGAILLDIGLAGKPVGTVADFTAAGVAGLSGGDTVGNVGASSASDATTSFVFTTGQTMTLSSRAQGAWSKDLGNEVLNDYLYLQTTNGYGGPVSVSLGNLGLAPGITYTLYLFGTDGGTVERSAFTPVNNAGITFASLTPSNGNLVVSFTTSPSYAGEPVAFTWARAAGSPTFAVFNGIAIQNGQQTVDAGVLKWKCSTAAAPWADKADVPLGETIPFNDAAAQRIVVNSASKGQVIDGWGGCFNERGWKAMEVLSPAARDALMNELFNPQTGLKLNLARTPIGASDYAIDLYSLNETAGDYTMTNFSIARDQQRLLPYIKAAQAIRPDLKLWASPWSPPSWMKNNNSLPGPGSTNSIKDNAQVFDALALYFARYVEAYAAEGVTIGMVMPQNEPNMTTNYTSCLWTGSQLARFIGYHLGPVFATRGLATEIYLGTINDDNDAGGYAYWVEPSMRDPQVLQYLDGLGCQWDSADTMSETHLLFPNMKLMQTEAECNHPSNLFTNTNDWAYAEYQFGLAYKWFGAGAGSNIVWNLVLDETGLSTGGWSQCSPVVVNSSTGAITYTPYFYLYKHFSYFIEPGAHIIASDGSYVDRIAFTNPDGSVVLVLANRSDNSLKVTLNIDGNRTAPITIPARSFNTFVSPPAPAALTAIQQWRTDYFGAAENSGNAANDADPDGDGISNALEFAIGTNPTIADGTPVDAQMVDGNFVFHYQRNKAAVNDGVQYLVEWSSDLASSTWSTTNVNEVIIDEDALKQQVIAMIPVTTDKLFVRLRVNP